MDPLYFPPFTHDVPLSVFYVALCSIWLHGDPFVSLPHPVWKGQQAQRRGESVSALFIAQSSRPSPCGPN